MRQIGDDLKFDPKDVVVVESCPQADMDDGQNLAIAQQFAYNKFAEMSHRFCSRSFNFSAGALSDMEKTRFNTCMDKYRAAFSIYQEENTRHFAAMEAIEKAGGDKFANLNQPDRF